MNFITNVLGGILRFFLTILSPLLDLRDRVRKKPKVDAATAAPGSHPGDPAVADPRHLQLRKMLIVVAAVTIIIGSLASVVLNSSPPQPKLNFAPYIGLGQALAKETAKELGDHGQIVALIMDPQQTKGSALNEEWPAFQREMRSHRSIVIIATVNVPLRDVDPTPILGREQFQDVLKKYSYAAAIVSFVDLPPWDVDNPINLPPDSPKIIAIQNDTATAKSYLVDSVATGLIMARPAPVPNPGAVVNTPEEWFNKYYAVYTAKDFAP